ncbi:MAG: chemotaxis response regulator protein-glutamate methylesterase [Armatimonadetes bacterium]|nr:chemotaxis response regulator protein-glutamate methylesterase [Armatimonadota bacterium]MCX7968668.1 chemotaxis response regulator protein-glutamate methylesterase [Armatimonadota bacterium]MDW8143408.1 chemotaxis response regulator protein-glutamate methylesterase [Armatimonadota bacterium]
MQKWCKVVVADDSAFMRLVITRVLNEDSEIEVVGTASNGAEAVELVKALRPSVLTLDVEMPVMDGLTALEIIMRDCPIPVVMVSALTREGAEVTMKALQLGAVDFIAKPSGSISLDFHKVKDELVAKVKAAAKAKLRAFPTLKPLLPLQVSTAEAPKEWATVVIGASTGGPAAVRYLLSQIPSDLPAAVLLVQHMPVGFTKFFADNLNQVSALPVHEVRDGETIEPRKVYLAPSGFHLLVGKGGQLKLDTSPPLHNVRPAADKTFESAANVFRQKCIGVVMTGMGSDGAVGLLTVKEFGGRTMVQAPETCVIPSMPESALKLGAAQESVPLEQLPQRITEVVNEVVKVSQKANFTKATVR